jgi:hypothetical protein
VRRVVAIAGNAIGSVALLVALGAIAAILWFTGQGVSIGSVIEGDPSGTETIAFPFLMGLLSMSAFFFGQYATRGRWGMRAGPARSSGTFTVVLRPLSPLLHASLLLLAVVAWFLVLPLPVLLEDAGALYPSPGSSAEDQFWFTVVLYGVVTAAIAAVVGGSLLKKLTYNRLLGRGRDSIVDGSPSQVRWRNFSHIWRGELMLAAFGGVGAGLAPLGIHLDKPAFGFGAFGIGTALLVISVGLALNSWRSGLPVERVESYT